MLVHLYVIPKDLSNSMLNASGTILLLLQILLIMKWSIMIAYKWWIMAFCAILCLIFISLIYASEHNGFCLRTIINQMELYNRGLMNISWNNSGCATVCVGCSGWMQIRSRKLSYAIYLWDAWRRSPLI